MSSGPYVEWKEDGSTGKKAKIGVIMFLIYTLVYVAFIIINVTYPKLMKLDIGSLNLAIVYGFGLIALAIIEAVIYNYLCSHMEEKTAPPESKRDGGITE